MSYIVLDIDWIKESNNFVRQGGRRERTAQHPEGVSAGTHRQGKKVLAVFETKRMTELNEDTEGSA